MYDIMKGIYIHIIDEEAFRLAPQDISPAQDMTFDTFYEENYFRVLRYLRARCSSYHDAEDLTSQAFTYCYQHWDDYDPAKASRSSWLFMIVTCRWKNYCRDHHVMSDIDDYSNIIPDERDPMTHAINLEAYRTAIARALKALPVNQQQAVILRYFGKKTDAEIAEKLGTSAGNVRVLISRALHKLEKDQSLKMEMET